MRRHPAFLSGVSGLHAVVLSWAGTGDKVHIAYPISLFNKIGE